MILAEEQPRVGNPPSRPTQPGHPLWVGTMSTGNVIGHREEKIASSV